MPSLAERHWAPAFSVLFPRIRVMLGVSMATGFFLLLVLGHILSMVRAAMLLLVVALFVFFTAVELFMMTMFMFATTLVVTVVTLSVMAAAVLVFSIL